MNPIDSPIDSLSSTESADRGPGEATNKSLISGSNVVGDNIKTDNKKYSSNSEQKSFQQDAEALDMTKRAKNHKKWNRRLKIFFCCLGYKKNKDSIGDVASIFAEFYADLNIASSDFAAGFVLLSKYQTAQRQWIVRNQQSGVEQYLSSVPITNETKFLDLSTAKDSHLINDLIYYMNYSLAIFGWPMQVIDDPCMLCCIYPYLKPTFCCSGGRKGKRKHQARDGEKAKQQQDTTIKGESNNHDNVNTPNRKPGELDIDCDRPIVLEDNCCGCNFASVERRLAAHNYEIIYVSYKVNVNVVPFLVSADHSKQSIVVAMRGSMSLSDMVTDMNGQIDRLPIDDCPDDWLCHRGITKAANYVKTTLLEEHILDRAFNSRPDLGSNEYNLVLCGHSLGAGVAAILGILLRKQYPSLKAFLYSPPGGMLSLPAVEYTKEFATGIILGNDCVPRLGRAQLERLRYHVLLSLKSSQKSTGKILAKAICPTCCLGGNKVEYDPSQSLNLLHGTGGRSFEFNGSKIPFQVQAQVLYVPGQLIHIVKNHSFKSRAGRLFNEPIYQAVWNENTAYDRIMISEGMFYDHLPNNLMHAMKMLFSKTLPARKDSNSFKRDSVDGVSQQPTPGINRSGDEDVLKVVSSDPRHKLDAKDSDNNLAFDENNNKDLPLEDENNNSISENSPVLETSSKQNLVASATVVNPDRGPISKIEIKNLDGNGNDESMPNNNLQ